jgi:hypothetical protein
MRLFDQSGTPKPLRHICTRAVGDSLSYLAYQRIA